MFDKTLTTRLKLTPAETEATKPLTQDAESVFRDLLLVEVKKTGENQPPLLDRLSAATGLSVGRAAEAAALVLTADAYSISPGIWKPRLRSLAFMALAGLFFWSPWYLRPLPEIESPRVAVRPDRTVPPFAPITSDHLTIANSPNAGAFEKVSDVLGRYAYTTLAGGTVLTPATVSAEPFPALASLSLVSLSASNLPAPLTARLPVRVSLAFSPRPQSGAVAITVADVWIVSEDRNAAVSRIVVAVTLEVAGTIGAQLASSEAAMVWPR